MSSLKEIGRRCDTALGELAALVELADSATGIDLFDNRFWLEDQLIRFRLWKAELGIDRTSGYSILEEKLRRNLEIRAIVEQLLTSIYENAKICRCN
jgi:hypothetical protein